MENLSKTTGPKKPREQKHLSKGCGLMIRHVMSDGTKRDSIEGVMIPVGHPAYRVIKEIVKGMAEAGKDAGTPTLDTGKVQKSVRV